MDIMPLDTFTLFKNFRLHDNVGLHTIEFTICVTKSTFHSIYCKMYNYMSKVHAIDPSRFDNLDDYPNLNPFDENCIFRQHSGCYPYISITYGIRVELSHSDEFAHIKFIVDPVLFMAGRKKEFDPDKYDYFKITQCDYLFLSKFVNTFTSYLSKWNVPDFAIDRLKITRVDFCINISILERFNLKKYFQYIRILPKYTRFNDKNKYVEIEDENGSIDTGDTCQCFRMNKYENMVKFGNKRHTITMYDKVAEQLNHFNRKFRNIKLLRIEYQPENQKIKTIAENVISNGYLDDKIDRRYNTNPFGHSLLDELWFLTFIAPYVILDAINMVFPGATIRSRTATLKRISKIECGKKTKNAMYEFVDIMSNSTSHSDMQNKIKSFKSMYGSNCYYRVIHLLEANNIAPIYMTDDDVKSLGVASLPSVRDIFLSAIKNDIEENRRLNSSI